MILYSISNSPLKRISLLLVLFFLSVAFTYAQGERVLSDYKRLSTYKEHFDLYFGASDRFEDIDLKDWYNEVRDNVYEAEKGNDIVATNYYKTILADLYFHENNFEETVVIVQKLYDVREVLDENLVMRVLELLDTSYGELLLFNKQLEVRTEKRKYGFKNIYFYDIYSNLGLHRDARKDYILHEKQKLEDGDYYGHANFNNNVGVYLMREKITYTAVHHYKMALSFVDLFLNKYDNGHDRYDEALFLKGLIKGNLGQSYMDLKRYDEAIPLLESDVKSSKEYANGRYLANLLTSWKELARSHTAIGNLDAAKAYLDTIEGNSNVLPIEFKKLKADYYLKKGAADSASYYYKKYIRDKDSVTDLLLDKTVLGLVVSSDLENQRITLEKQKQDIIKSQNEILERDKKLTYGKIVLFFSLLILGGIIFAYTKKSKRQRLIEDQNKIIEQSLVEKDSLLKEIHHRVKNNLQMVSSLLSLQSRNTRNDEVVSALEEGKSRVKAMALIHQKLYQTEDLSVIEMDGYIDSLVKSISSVFNKNSENEIDISIDAKDVELDVDTAIPIGLILNELVSNSFKYAFKGIPDPQIQIQISKDENRNYFNYHDNGVGIPADVNLEDNKTLGIRLVNRLVAQLKSKLHVQNNGTGVEFWFYFN